MEQNNAFKNCGRWSLLCMLSGILAGLAAAVFLGLLDRVTEFRDSHQWIIWFLPIAGFLIGWVYHVWGRDVAEGSKLILREIETPQRVLPFRMGPLIFLSTLLTHLFGGSAGREGTAVQMGSILTDQMNKLFQLSEEERKILLITGLGAGFAAATGGPWAGMMFGLEVLSMGEWKLKAWWSTWLASFTAYGTFSLTGLHHSLYPPLLFPVFEVRTFLWVALAGICFGLTAMLFGKMTHLMEVIPRRLLPYPPLRPFCAGLLLVAFYRYPGLVRYAGLGISGIQDALMTPAGFKDPILKSFFTSLTLGPGFKGGEFTPLVFIGTTLGSALSTMIPVPFQLLAALGFVSVFAGAAKTPMACVLLSMEIFGYEIFPYAFLACFVSFFSSGRPGIYRTQGSLKRKNEDVKKLFRKMRELSQKLWGER